MQAIRTKFLGPTNTRGSRVKATCDAGSITVEWHHAWNVEENHAFARARLCDKLGWHLRWVMGSIGGEYYHVCDAT